MKITVIICAHNPRPATLGETIAHLRRQTLPTSEWELLVIDNASTPPLAATGLTDWHPHGRVVRVDELGLTPARLGGIAAARGEFLVFVDDDNWLEPDYLAVAQHRLEADRTLGVIAGQCFGVFEREPVGWQLSYLWLVVIRTFTAARRTRDPSDREALPAGAGMCLRREIALNYAEFCATNPAARLLDRRGTAVLMQGGDTHIVKCAIALGFEVGVFPELRLRHYIPAGRLQLDYLAQLYAGIVTSGYLLGYLASGQVSWPRRDVGWWLRQIRGRLRNFHHQASFLQAEIRGEKEARRLIEELRRTTATTSPTANIPPSR